MVPGAAAGYHCTNRLKQIEESERKNYEWGQMCSDLWGQIIELFSVEHEKILNFSLLASTSKIH